MSKPAAGKKPRPIIRVVKKTSHAAHHGGSWKVAYADFVTAMMAFFMVMWIVGMDEKTKTAVEGYFSNPIGFKKGYASGKSPLSTGNAPTNARTSNMSLAIGSFQQKKFFETKKAIEAGLAKQKVLDSASMGAKVDVTVTSAGLRIELIEGSPGNTFFPFASAAINEAGRRVIQTICADLINVQMPIEIEGHTDAAAYARSDYTNWELSADRGNAARRVLHACGMPPSQISGVKAFADRFLHVPDDPLHPSNRRISLLVPFTVLPTPAPAGADSANVEIPSGPLPLAPRGGR